MFCSCFLRCPEVPQDFFGSFECCAWERSAESRPSCRTGWIHSSRCRLGWHYPFWNEANQFTLGKKNELANMKRVMSHVSNPSMFRFYCDFRECRQGDSQIRCHLRMKRLKPKVLPFTYWKPLQYMWLSHREEGQLANPRSYMINIYNVV